MTEYAVRYADIEAAARRIEGWIHHTPVVTSRLLDALAGRRLYFKCENLQRVGAFKFRGASNAVLSLSDSEAERGVVTHSSGNHAQALALAAHLRGIPAHIVMPSNAPAVKRRAVEAYGGRIVECEPTLAAREATAARVVAETGAVFVHPYDNPHVIAGQGTAALELLAEVPQLDAILVPVGGGGLTAGTAIAAHGARAGQVRVFACEPSGADDAARSRVAGTRLEQAAPATIADGLRTSLGELTWPVVRDLVTAVHTVDDAQILEAMWLFWERTKLVIEPSSAVPLAVALYDEAFRARDGLAHLGVILSGGNADIRALASAAGQR